MSNIHFLDYFGLENTVPPITEVFKLISEVLQVLPSISASLVDVKAHVSPFTEKSFFDNK